MTARRDPRIIEQLVLVIGYIVVVAFVATFDWRVAGVLAGIGLMAATLDLSTLRRRS
jgi:hypothetical protein